MFSRNRINESRERAASAGLPGGSLLVWTAISLGSLLVAVTAIGAAHLGDGLPSVTGGPPAPAGMVLIPGGEFLMGSENFFEDEKPVHKVMVNDFFLDRHEVTNARFAVFVKATGHVTTAEREGHCWAYFEGGTEWQYAEGTDWRHPQGPGSTIEHRPDHPVVCVSWEDAAAYAAWAGRRLPTEAEWEFAARAGDPGHFVARTGEEQPVETEVTANVWEGEWPAHNRLEDGYFYTAPAGSFPANAAGVHDMLGNVWEWTADWYDAEYYAVSPGENPRGPESGDKRVARGGSWFCSPNYCGAYSTHYRGGSPPGHAFNNVGFRCAGDIPDGAE
jgi:sulfatase modifying factor 1